MGFRFRRSIGLGKGVRLNIGKKGISSVSVGKRGIGVSIGKKGPTGRVGIPGTGMSYRTKRLGCAMLSGLVILLCALAVTACSFTQARFTGS